MRNFLSRQLLDEVFPKDMAIPKKAKGAGGRSRVARAQARKV
jgi:hypothetical protein